MKNGNYQDVWEDILDETALRFMMDEKSYPMKNSTRVFQKIDRAISTQQKKDTFIAKPRRQTFRVAATISLALVALVTLILINKNYLFQSPLVWMQENTTSNQRKGIQLEDGTQIWLNAGSQLRFPEKFGAAQRVVYLQGEAFFQVAEDSLRPFVVHTKDIHTTVLGTSFNIDFHDKENLEVTVTTGKVKVDQIDSLTENERALAVLTPNQQLTFNQRTHQSDIHEVEAADYLVWREESLTFKNTPMQQVARMLEQYYNQPIAFENEAIWHCQLTATFHRTESFEKVLNTISTISDISYKIRNHTVYLAGEGCDLAQ
uniref:FecR domain-containing protein n=1 Tax=Roseihalotalea indica TaxID=2867963 RepID=A0AA49JFU6_9BACT|nr:FecR domain-containing protein [Tunicatimonas sp. TK19036]